MVVVVHAETDTITLNGSDLGGATNITFNATSVSAGDVIYVQNGIYKESLPMIVPAGVTLRGESLRGTEIRPASGSGTQIKNGFQLQQTQVVLQMVPYNYIHANATSGSGVAATAVF